MTKRIISIILCVVLCFAILPFTVYAEEPEAGRTTITDVELNSFNFPLIGQDAGDNLISVTVPNDAPYEIFEAEWEDTYGETVLPDEAFEADGSYYAVFVIRAAEGYAFDSAATNATINGDTALIDMSIPRSAVRTRWSSIPSI